MPGHPIVHVEIAATDPVALGKFYANVFGWEVETDPTFNYTQFEADGGPGGGFPGVGGPEGYKVGDIVPYIGTDDIDESLRKVESAGGRVLVPKSEIPGIGWFAMFSEPTGNRMALYTSMRPQGNGSST